MSAATIAVLWLATNAAMLVLQLVIPQARAPLFGEDRLIETATALLFLAAGLGGLASLIVRRSRRYRVLLVIASTLGLVGFLDEISFGARLFGWSMPGMTGGGQLDGVHDLVILTYRGGVQADPIVTAAIGTSLVLIASLYLLFRYADLTGLAHRVHTDPPYGLFAFSVGGLATAAILDLGIGFLRHLGPLEEIIEMNAGLALLLAVLRAGPGPRSGRPPPEDPLRARWRHHRSPGR